MLFNSMKGKNKYTRQALYGGETHYGIIWPHLHFTKSKKNWTQETLQTNNLFDHETATLVSWSTMMMMMMMTMMTMKMINDDDDDDGNININYNINININHNENNINNDDDDDDDDSDNDNDYNDNNVPVAQPGQLFLPPVTLPIF